ncbi:MAG: type IX secretion system PorP/SprF family membrane protein [Roseivirga sp.]|jgi:type IX secretion system PorP/SprF family membrane protein
MRKVILLLVAILGVGLGQVRAQDPQFSQFYAAPLYINPAFTGASGFTRVGLNYRNQWPSLDASFVTASVYVDHFIEKYNSGIGFIVTTDKEGVAGLKSSNFGVSYAYQLKINDNLVFRPGIQVNYFMRNANFTDLVFASQIDPVNGFDPSLPGDPSVSGSNLNVNYLDFSVGGIFYSRNLFLGGSIQHITEPNQSLLDGNSPLPQRISIHGGYKIYLKEGALRRDLTYTRKERSITPVFQYKTQGQFSQLDVGFFLHLEPINLGLQYRGLPHKKFENFPNNEALVFTFGVTKDDFNFGYSFDYTLSDLGVAAGGAHEISIAYFLQLGKPLKVPRDKWRIPCPKN